MSDHHAGPNDPFNRPDGTVIRPRPGAGRQGWADPGAIARRAAAGTRREPIPVRRRARLLAIGLNPLVRPPVRCSCSPGRSAARVAPIDITSLRRHALVEMRSFEERARAAGVPQETVIAARYVLCAALDEAVLSTPWGAQSEWSQHPLLVALHREAWGGEKFFDMLERISTDPDTPHRSDGAAVPGAGLRFHGQVPGARARARSPRRPSSRISIGRIRHHRGTAPADLSLRWRGLEDRRNPLIRYVPWWVVAAAALAILTIAFTVYYARLARAAAPVHAELAKIGLEDFSAPAACAGQRTHAEAAARAGGGARDDDRGRAGRAHGGHAARGRTCSRRAARRCNPTSTTRCAGSRLPSIRYLAACWSSGTPTISRSSRFAIGTTSSSRASAP